MVGGNCNWLFTSVAKGLSSGLLRTSGQSGTRIKDCRIASPTRWTLGYPDKHSKKFDLSRVPLAQRQLERWENQSELQKHQQNLKKINSSWWVSAVFERVSYTVSATFKNLKQPVKHFEFKKLLSTSVVYFNLYGFLTFSVSKWQQQSLFCTEYW